MFNVQNERTVKLPTGNVGTIISMTRGGIQYRGIYINGHNGQIENRSEFHETQNVAGLGKIDDEDHLRLIKRSYNDTGNAVISFEGRDDRDKRIARTSTNTITLHEVGILGIIDIQRDAEEARNGKAA